MFAPSPLSRLILTAVAAAWVTATAAGTALADQGPSNTIWRPQDHLYRGKVTARTGLLVRSAPNRHSSSLGRLDQDQIIWIKCRLTGEAVSGNASWYKLADGRQTWASARYIAALGRGPRDCR